MPVGWEWSTLDDIAIWGSGGTPKRSVNQYYDGGSIPWVTIADLNNGVVEDTLTHITELGLNESSAKIVPKDSILLALYGSIGKLGIAGRDLATNQAIATAIPKNDWFETKYLYYFLESQKQNLNQLGSGVTQKNIYLKDLKSVQIPVAPRKEQKRIAEKLDELFSELEAGVKELNTAQIKLKHYRQSLLKSAVEGALTQKWRDDNKYQIEETGKELLNRILIARKQRWEQAKLAEFKEKGKTPPKNWQEKYPEPVQPDTTDLPELPEGWVWASLDQCIEQAKDITDGPFGSNLKTEHYIESGPRVIRLQNIGDGEFLNDKAHISKERYNNLIKHAVEPNDILIAMMGEDLPRACLPPNDISPAIVKADCARVRLNNEIVNSHLVMHFLNSIPVRSRTKSAVKGVGRPRINLGYIRSIAIPIPPQLEQTALLTEINNQLDSVNRQFVASEISLKQSEVQRKNILKSAFAGELVSQDENDEPAFSLLEAIKKEREEQAKQAKPSKKRQTKKKVDVMNTLLEVLTAEDRWIDAQEAFKKCGIVDGSSIDRVEEIYAELRKLEKSGQIEIERNGSYDQIRFIKED
nr:restriction endonuclease subunit S [Pseudoalteromonas sp. CNAT2-18.1]